MMVKILLPIWLFSWAILLPVDSVHSRVGNNTGLALLTYGNISNDKSVRYAAHIILVYFFTGRISSQHSLERTKAKYTYSMDIL